MKTSKELILKNSSKKSQELVNKLFINSRGNYVHIKLCELYNYNNKELKFDMCEAKTKEEAIKLHTGKWMFTNNIYSAIKKGKLIPVK